MDDTIVMLDDYGLSDEVSKDENDTDDLDLAPLGGWEKSAQYILLHSRIPSGPDANSVTWDLLPENTPLPLKKNPKPDSYNYWGLGQMRFYDTTSNRKQSSLTIWDDGRYNLYYRWWSTRRHRGDDTVHSMCRVFWQYKNSGHKVEFLQEIGFGDSWDDKPQPRRESKPRRAYVPMSSTLFGYLTHPNVETVIRWYVRHK